MRRFLLPALLVAEVVGFSLLSAPPLDGGGLPAYLVSYFSDLLVQSAPVLLLALGMTLVLMTSGIDLSVGSMVALVAGVISTFDGTAAFWWTAVPVGLALALALGATNGVLVGVLDVPPVIATLGTMIFYRGLCFVVLGDHENAPFLDVPGYEAFGGPLGASLVVLAAYAGAGSWLRRSRWRREILMLGGNRVAARYAAIPVVRRTIETYTLVGLCAFAAALVFTARNSSVSASSLTGLELRVIVAVVLGGTRVEGGRGSLSGTFFGVLIISVLDEGLRGAAIWGDAHLPFKISHLQFILLGALLLLGVWLNSHGARRRPPAPAGALPSATSPDHA